VAKPVRIFGSLAGHGVVLLCQQKMNKSLLEQPPEIVRAGKRQAERILDGLEWRR
jgi:hypothetical protein